MHKSTHYDVSFGRQCRMTTFRYKEVLGEDRIRIMELFAGVGNDPLQCHLTSELRQGTTDSYDALSYAWGSREKMDEIICCNEVLSITANLAGALRGLRSKKAGTMRRLWVDALCIDQGNSEEKNHQVKHLGRVYEDATEVVVWLGPDKEGIAEYCFSTVEQWTRYLDEQFEISSSKHPLDMLLLRPPRHLYIDVGGALKLKTFMSRAWFSRVCELILPFSNPITHSQTFRVNTSLCSISLLLLYIEHWFC